MNSSPQPKKNKITLQVVLAFLVGGILQFGLLYFIVSGILLWQTNRFEKDIDLSIPAAETQDDKERQVGEMVINVVENGDIVVAGNVLTREELIQLLNKIVRKSPDHAIILRGHTDANFDSVIGVLDTIKAAGIWNFAFASSKP